MAVDEERVDGRKLRYAGRRQELLDAASAYVMEHGVGELAMRPMAEAVGVSHATLLNHFGSKEQLVIEVIAGFSRRSLEQSVPLDQLVRDAHGRIDVAAALETFWQRFSQPAHVRAIQACFEVLGQAMVRPERYEAFVDDYLHDWRRRLLRLARAGGCPEDQAEATATMMLAGVRGCQADLAATGDHARVDAAHAVFTRMLRDLQASWPVAG